MSSRPYRALALLLAVPALACGVAACGGGDDDGGGGGALSAADYRSAVKKICADGKKQADALKEPTGPDAGQIKQFLRQGTDISKQQNDQLRNLKPPDELKSAHAAAVKYREEVVTFLSDLVGKIPDNADQAKLQQVLVPLQQKSDEFDKRGEQVAKDLGVPECAQA